MSPALIEGLGVLAGALTTGSFLPQVLKVVRERQTAGISLAMYIAFTAGVFLWLIYGIMMASIAITLANMVTLLLAGAVLVMKIRLG